MAVIGNGALSMMSYRVSTKRPPAVAGSRRGALVTYLTDVPCTSLLPVVPEVAARFPSKTPTELLQAFVPGNYDVREGDYLIHGSKEYPIREAAEWSLRERKITMLVLEETKISA